MSGLSVLRAWWPGLLLVELPPTASEEDAVRALDDGADDAFPATAPDRLVVARLAALLRRSEATMHRLGPLTIDRVGRQVARSGQAIELLPKEYCLLLHFAEHAGELLTRTALLRAVFGLHFDPGTNVLDVHLSRLRAKLDRPFDYPLIHTEKGRGFRLVAQSPCERESVDAPHAALAVAAIAATR
ncbi:MAG: DNA-binding response regulator [Sphingomonas sp.]